MNSVKPKTPIKLIRHPIVSRLVFPEPIARVRPRNADHGRLLSRADLLFCYISNLSFGDTVNRMILAQLFQSSF